MPVRSPWRNLLYKRLEEVALSGAVIDLGGSRKSSYLKGFKGEYTLTVANLEGEETHDVKINLEEPFAIADAQYDHVLCINVLEHIFNYQNVIQESFRILKPGGQAVFAVPFLVQVHPSPHDHWRFTGETLQRLFTEAGFTQVMVEPIGTGVFGAAAQLKFNVLKVPLLRAVCIGMSKCIDTIVAKLPNTKNFSKDFYPLGYVVILKK